MCDVELASNEVEVDPSRMEHIEGMKGKFVVPLADIAQVSTSDDPDSLVRGVKTGTGLAKTKIGTWHHDGGEDYLCIRDNRPAVVIDLKPGQKMARVVVSVEDPAGLAASIQAAMGAGDAGSASS